MRFTKTLLIAVMVLLCGMAKASFPDFTEVVEKVRPSVVVIKTEVESRGRKAAGPSGSGFVIDKEGYVLTNRHVIHGVKTIYVQLVNNKVYTAELLGEDAGTDIAVLKIDADGLKAVAVGNVEKLKVGAWVLAYGAPFGLEHSVTAGIVSAKGRSLRSEQYVPFIQTDAAVNRGNSGGPLFNQHGEVVGINSQIFSMSGGNMGLAFAIPMDLAMEVANQIRTEGKVLRGYLGVGYEDVDFEKADAFGLKDVRGALINSVAAGSPAEKGGLKIGDIVIEVNGKSVETGADLPFLIGRIKPETQVDAKVIREGKKKTIRITVGERPENQVASTGPNSGAAGQLGLTVTEMPDQMKESGEINYGVLVQRVSSGAAEDAGIREGDILQMINQQRITSVNEFEAAVGNLPESGVVAVLVVRRGFGPRFLVLRLAKD